jgi:hypothetical protein
MAVWGVSSRLSSGEVLVIGLEATGAATAPTALEILRHRSLAQEDWAQKLALLASDMDTQLARLTPSAIVVRSMDWSKVQREATVRHRYQIEGAILSAARRRCAVVRAMSGREIGLLLGKSKSAAEADVQRLLPGVDMDAGIATLAALTL